MSASAELLCVYQELDEAMQSYLGRTPQARCPNGCHKCCTCAAPLVSEHEWSAMEAEIRLLSAAQNTAVRERAKKLRRDLEAGDGDDFACPLLEQGRCLVYAARPYLCRSFGHSSRQDANGETVPYSCDVLQKAIQQEMPPLFEFRISILRRRVGNGVLCDSYIPIWLSTRPEQRCVRDLANGCSIVVAAPEHRLDMLDDEPSK